MERRLANIITTPGMILTITMAAAGKITIAEVEELVPVGELDPNFIHTPGIYIQIIFQG